MAEDTTEVTAMGPPKSDLNAWYASQRPRYIDLVGDYAGRELFLIEGDSLLRECFSDTRLDFRDGFQMLHAVFVVERFLENLLKRHCRFVVAFIDENAGLCIPAGVVAQGHRARYRLARGVVIRHLQMHLPSTAGVEVLVFPSLKGEAFETYLETSPVHFVMAHDGALPSTGEATEDVVGKTLLRQSIWWFNNKGLNVALINRIDFRDSKVFTMIIERTAGRGKGHEWQSASTLFQNDESKASMEGLNVQECLAKSEIQSIITDERSTVPETWLIVACTVSILLSQDVLPEDEGNPLCSAFVLHIILIKHLSISQRRLPDVTFDEELESQIENFLALFADTTSEFLANEEWAEAMRSNGVNSDLIDLVDGRLFRVVLQACLEGSLVSALPQVIRDEWSMVSAIVQAISSEILAPGQGKDAHDTHKQEAEDDEDVAEFAVMPFTNEVFDSHLACIHVTTDTTLPSRLTYMKLYRETTHWHNRRPQVLKSAVPVKVSKWRNPLRMNQFYMAEMTAYAASLTGAKGKVLEPETITVGVKKLTKLVELPASSVEASSSIRKGGKEEKPGKQGKQAQKTDDPSTAKKGGKKAAAGLTKAQQIVAGNKEKKGVEESDKVLKAWKGMLKDFDNIPGDQERYLRAKAYLDGLDSAKAIYVEADINLYILQSLLSLWSKYCKADKKADGYHVAALIWTVIRTTYTSDSNTKEVALHIEKMCDMLSIRNAMGTPNAPFQSRPLSFVFKYPINPQALNIGLSQSDFQLLHVGPYMDRFLDAKPDPRVSSFIPDGWQRKVLDELDANNSVFVVAPTSAGKTFISFYAMEQVLRADNDGVLVYVAPTKALVNQIAAEVQGRFSKKFPLAGKSVWAIHTRDYRVNNSTGCQILVTVPHILQIMLLAPTNAKAWAPRVRRIIFDEIHSIGQAEDGVVWEQLLLLAPCPIIALSATVGNPTEFSDWLAETQKASGTKLTMIQHSTRYSDLRKYVYKAPQTFKFEGFGKSQGGRLGLDGLSGLTYFHPIASLVDTSRGMTDDLALEPRDCLLLWRAMCKFQTNEYKMPSSLDPSKSLPPCIRKADIFKWEKELKKVLMQWMDDVKKGSPFEKVVRELSPSDTLADIEEETINNDDNVSTASGDVVDQHDLRATTLPLLYQLHQRQALPAILFNYDRSGCEKIAAALLSQLTVAEDHWKEGKEWQRKLEEWAKWKELKDKRGAKKPPKVSKSKGGDEDDKTSKADQARDAASSEVTSFDLFDPEEPQDNFSFADKRRCQKAELDGYIYQLRRKRIRESLIGLLKRGIGVHHSGMNRKYRQCVEMLFRKGFLRVVVATGTLSLGINMPCATVVFSGDSVFLTALNFRQASGRSGRRGFDLLGNVVFQGIPQQRVSRLLSSRLPDLTGHFPITTTLVLRLFTLLHDSKNAPYAVKAINSLLSQPRLYLGGKSFKEQVLHHLRFSIEYLRRQSLLGPCGEPINFTSCISHLYFTENSSFAFHALLNSNYLKTLCADIDTKTENVLRTMMLVLSHLFGRQICRETDDEETAEKIRRSSSMVYLPPLPTEAAAVLRQHNAKTLSIFTTYVQTFAEQHVQGEERLLPLTGVAVGIQEQSDANRSTTGDTAKANGHANGSVDRIPKNEEDTMILDFLPTLPIPRARSAFVALSGHGDNFVTINDLCTSARSGIFLESAIIPHLELHPDESRTPLNAYLLDFFMHGALQPLEDANGISRSDVWFVLNDFSLVLATIVTSLAGYLGLTRGDVDDEILDTMGSGDLAENEGDEDLADTASSAASTAATSITTASQTSSASSAASRKPRRVAEDWDAAEDAIVAQEQRDEEEDSLAALAGTDDQEYEKLKLVYRAFRKLKTEFDAKFLLIWA